ncbi:DUF6343 family protein [Allostreptomyces psammosilenae]|uniref:Uncharacterized protein n=1 Tax=Allostreptomyces psammosilenae TaxID=1892865 RepID=A0A852ZNZ2_9ACTN|nr:DUF6343 family protein [Allostreptomyces psammosilenae]NYI04099.1 hypothetical protein [Allostreptomyces psammosilenae]
MRGDGGDTWFRRGPWGRGRSGTEPVTARSALRLRAGLAAGGLVVCAAVAVLLAVAAGEVAGMGWLVAALVVLAVVAAVDLVVVGRRIRRHGRN